MANQIDKVTFFWKVLDLQGLIGHLEVIRSNNLHNLETSRTAEVGVT